MPKTDPPKAAGDGIETLFLELLPVIPATVRRTCRKFDHHPDDASFEGLVHRIILLLMDEDYRRLRTFGGQSSPETWLDRVVRNYIYHHLRRLGKEVSLDAVPEGSFLSSPDQEEMMLFHERLELVDSVVATLTERERKFYQLLCEDGLTTAGIAKAMGIKVTTLHRYRHDLIRKIQKLIEGRDKRSLQQRE